MKYCMRAEFSITVDNSISLFFILCEYDLLSLLDLASLIKYSFCSTE